MATPKAQRVGIWIITIVMVVGVVGSFAVMILSTQNQNAQQSSQEKLLAEYQKQLKQQQTQDSALSAQYFPTFNQYRSTPSQFDPTTVGSSVTTQDLVVGGGDTISNSSQYEAYYIGWNPDGKMFDSSFASDGKSLNTPLQVTPGGVIQGWTDGTNGMKVGGIREITIPAPLAYGSTGQGSDIPPNTPLKFIVYIIKKD